MDHVARGLELLSLIADNVVSWNRAAFRDTLECFRPEQRPTLATVTIDDYFYDRTIAHAELDQTPVPVRVQGRKGNRMRWLRVGDEQFSIALWLKKVDRDSLLTSNAKTEETDRRRNEGTVFMEDLELPLFICGHVLLSDVLGVEYQLDGVWITREGMEVNGRRKRRLVTLARRLWSNQRGMIPLEPTENFTLPLYTEDDVPAPRVRPRLPETPATGTDGKMPQASADPPQRDDESDNNAGGETQSA